MQLNNKNSKKKTTKELNQKTGENIHRDNSLNKIDRQEAREKSSTLLIIRYMQIKTTVRYQVTPNRMAIIKKSTKDRCWRECGEEGNSLTVGGNGNWYKYFGSSLKKKKNQLRTTA